MDFDHGSEFRSEAEPGRSDLSTNPSGLALGDAGNSVRCPQNVAFLCVSINQVYNFMIRFSLKAVIIKK